MSGAGDGYSLTSQAAWLPFCLDLLGCLAYEGQAGFGFSAADAGCAWGRRRCSAIRVQQTELARLRASCTVHFHPVAEPGHPQPCLGSLARGADQINHPEPTIPDER